ncbi:MAG: D-amino-acid transaminase [Geminicoccaceae bacterium]|nr:D-amino-acid transaminase [Geminicoccaceae bacterium]
MSRIAYVNGRYVPIATPAVAIEDRGYQFADGVYEVIRVVEGTIGALDRHLDRLERSLSELSIRPPMSRAALAAVIRETLRRNRLHRAIVYIQISRGIAPRNHLPPASGRASLVVTVRRAPFPDRRQHDEGCRVISLPDERWKRCDIKSIGLLPNLLARQKAREAGAREAWMLDDDGRITEGTSSNAYIIDRDGRLVTRPLGPRILGGITRSLLLELARKAGIEVIERPFTLEEARTAREAFLTSTTSLVLPVVQIDDCTIANGMPGTLTRRLQEAFETNQGLDVLYERQKP